MRAEPEKAVCTPPLALRCRMRRAALVQFVVFAEHFRHILF
jgi:hypothetical protein